MYINVIRILVNINMHVYLFTAEKWLIEINFFELFQIGDISKGRK